MSNWSSYQQNIFSFVSNETGNGIVQAVAGSGKTTTIVEALKRVRGSSIFLAFNKSIADELKKRGVNAKTFHSLTFTPVMRSRKQKEPSMDKLRKLYKNIDWAAPHLEIENPGWYRSFAEKLVGLARQTGIGCLVNDCDDAWYEIVTHHDLQIENENADIATGVRVAQELLSVSNASQLVDFDDMLYFSVKDDIALDKFDFVFVDEAQDTNAIQRAILRKILKPTSRVIFVGDPAQAIYGFRGADSDSMQLLAQEFNCTQLPLTITYRCAKSVVSYAQQWVSHIEAREGAPEGKVQELRNWSPTVFQPNDLVVCRTTAPILTTAFKCIRASIPVQVMGRDIGQGLKSLIKQMDATDIDMLKLRLEAYMEREVEAALEKEDEAKAEAISDKVGSLILMIDNLKEGKRSLEQLDVGIDYLFKGKENALKLATIHKSKGLEAERVFWLESSKCPSNWAKQPWQQQQEINLCYVAATRAKNELYLIELDQAA
jgi:DNA helicase-2/ATP-dependent DNA helicase PcrA